MRTAELVQRAIDYIEERLNEPLTLEQIAAASAMSVPHLYRMFYAMTGHPIKEYIRKRRTNEAGCLLRQTGMSVIDVGFQSGFDSYQTFLKAFKRTTGITPGMYRESDIIYSFERIRLNERVAYCEDREVSERYPDVSVIRLSKEQGVGYLHRAEQEDGLEEAALELFRMLLLQAGLDVSSLRLFGWNIELEEGGPSCGYQMAAVNEGGTCTLDVTEHGNASALVPMQLPGGLYAMTRTSYGSATIIVAAWNHLLSEWLPRSTFALGDHGMMEEYMQLNGNIARMKLYLPVRRSQQTDMIEVALHRPIRVASFQAAGIDRVKLADEASLRWLEHSGLDLSSHPYVVYMTGSCASISDEDETYEVCIAASDDDDVRYKDGESQIKELAGGLYACLKTEAYGFMTGVLERLYRWLAASTDYEMDVDRDWYARYQLDPDNRASIGAACFVPVRSTQS